MASPPPAVRVAPTRPVASAAPASTPVVPVAPVTPSASGTATQLSTVVVKPGDSLWKIAQQNLGKGLRWRDLLAVNPGIVDANRIAAGTQIYLPAAVSTTRTASKITVRKGDTLSIIARTRLGHASYWSCIAQANPAILDANRIYEGQSLLLPGSCKP